MWLWTPAPAPLLSGRTGGQPQLEGILPSLACLQPYGSPACRLGRVAKGAWAMAALSVYRRRRLKALAGLWASLSSSPSHSALSYAHRALLRKLGGLFLPPEANLSLDSSEGILARTVLRAVSAPSSHVGWAKGTGVCPDPALMPTPSLPLQAVEQLLASGQSLLIFLEEPPGCPGPRLSALGQAWLGLVVQAVQAGIIPDATLVPVAIAYDLVPDAPWNMNHVRPSCPWGPSRQQFWVVQCSVAGML